VSISNSIASFNTSDGFYFLGVTASLDASSASNNGDTGALLFSGTLALGRSTLMNNASYGIFNSGGTLNSYKDNRIAGNGTPVSGTISAATLY
jgi:hypothetical protein